MPYDMLVTVTAAAGLAAGITVALTARAPREGLRTLLDFLLAAGLLHLAAGASWSSLAVAAITLVVRRIATAPLRHHAQAGLSPHPVNAAGSG